MTDDVPLGTNLDYLVFMSTFTQSIVVLQTMYRVRGEPGWEEASKDDWVPVLSMTLSIWAILLIFWATKKYQDLATYFSMTLLFVIAISTSLNAMMDSLDLYEHFKTISELNSLFAVMMSMHLAHTCLLYLVPKSPPSAAVVDKKNK